MNTISLVLNGKTAAYIRSLPEKERSSITSLRTSNSNNNKRPSPLSRSQTDYDIDTFSIGAPALPSEPSSPISPVLRRSSAFSFTRSISEMSTSTISSFTSGGSAPSSSIFAGNKRKESAFSTHFTFSSAPSSPSLAPNNKIHSRSSSGSITPRPTSSSRSKSYSPGWYTPNENNFTLDDFARKLNTRSKRFEVYVGRCAQNVVMALFSPTPVVLFLFNPISLLVWVVMGFLWWSSGSGSGETQG